MDPVLYVLAILGCSDTGTGCTTARIADMGYASASACRAAAPAVLMTHTDLDFPTLRVDCRRASASAARRITRNSGGNS